MNIKRIFARLVAVPFAAAAIAAAPAHAEDIPVEKVAGQGSSALVIGDEDAEYRQLFAQWRTEEKTRSGQPMLPQVAVPSGMPLSDAHLTSDYGMRTHPVLGGRRSHKGVDLAAATGTPVYATADGRVEMAQHYSSYGNYVQIGHGAQLETRFAHLSRIAVTEGQRVRKGELIGYVGSTGRSTGPHLHYEVRVGGEAVNPIPYMAQSQAQQDFALETGHGGRGGPE
ncbi:M23 family metallopeptidase [Qipengyuania atrilutea]|uniref:M23 family metallopeptidase n=1 Tax=Qipengyuania atrilutea TaxID=2744473 RepID=A0A850H1Y1_9SPHN|nr:M23 family metallopeptidase [Actirhodobacter atriluteus]NVD44597.1 M23 family metallopeptidase [Actirhodobacter atriluteus]